MSKQRSSRRRLSLRPNTVLGTTAEDNLNRDGGDAQPSLPPTAPAGHQRNRLSLRIRNSDTFADTPQNVNKVGKLELNELKLRQNHITGNHHSSREFSGEQLQQQRTDPLYNENLLQ